MVFGIRIF
ncbi:hypothetical protein BpHYR1_054373 [Brachionus plicatilis]|uniref:Uncharacterized protein n=1 Tax=Brachionus plicatilis TaxID=10195 RepID=A0A3M7PC91_BRAPC|nr:hypothetical protein BpHYR1_054373 [Brachionus plicatilis]